jgi:hypothetical protein
MVAAFLLLMAPVRYLHPQTSAAAVIYSNVEYNDESGDLLGFEIELHSGGAFADGVLRNYQGGCGAVTAVHGKVEQDRVHLEGTGDPLGKAIVDGMLRANALDATIRFEKAPKAETVHLEKIAKAHC